MRVSYYYNYPAPKIFMVIKNWKMPFFFLRLFIVGMKMLATSFKLVRLNFQVYASGLGIGSFPIEKNNNTPGIWKFPNDSTNTIGTCAGETQLPGCRLIKNKDGMTFLSLATLLTVHLYYFSLLLGEHPKLSEVWFEKTLYNWILIESHQFVRKKKHNDPGKVNDRLQGGCKPCAPLSDFNDTSTSPCCPWFPEIFFGWHLEGFLPKTVVEHTFFVGFFRVGYSETFPFTFTFNLSTVTSKAWWAHEIMRSWRDGNIPWLDLPRDSPGKPDSPGPGTGEDPLRWMARKVLRVSSLNKNYGFFFPPDVHVLYWYIWLKLFIIMPLPLI